MGSVLGLILLGFGFGVVAVIAFEAVGLLWIMKRLRHKLNKEEEEAKLSSQTQLGATTAQLDHQQSLHFAFQKQVVFHILTFWLKLLPPFSSLAC